MRSVVLLTINLVTVCLLPFYASTADPCDGVLGCSNHGTCAGTIEDGLHCVCDPGYYGMRCQLYDDPSECMMSIHGNETIADDELHMILHEMNTSYIFY